MATWTHIREFEDSDQRAEEMLKYIRKVIGAKWCTYIRMMGSNNRTRYFLLHLTNSNNGRDLMKEVVWKCCPENGYYARQKDDHRQQYLIQPEPDLKPLRGWLIKKLSQKPCRWQDLDNILREEIWLPKHLRSIIIDMRKSGEITGSDYSDRFSRKANPILTYKA